jgi:methylenetetrahydrofolate dehydrogenase (NADP+) / methenyltetrahydrofolate cyclohydrolase
LSPKKYKICYTAVTMIVDGRELAADILASVQEEVLKLGRTPCLAAVTCAPNFETKKYLEMKKRKAASVGVSLTVVELPEESTTEDVVQCVERVIAQSDGVVVQLPLPPHINVEAVLAAVPAHKDPDGFLYGQDSSACLSPVVGAIDEISHRYGVVWEGKRVVVLGAGRLVGRPAAAYARARGAEVTVLTKETYDASALRSADIIITGVGQPHLITPELVKEHVIIFDAGTSEDGGVLVGDVSPAVADQASLLTPVPGGIGPITIAYLLRNLVALTR